MGESVTTKNFESRVPVELYASIKAMADREKIPFSKAISSLLSKALLTSNGKVTSVDVLEEAFCRALAEKGDISEVQVLKEIAQFRALSVMDLVLSHVRYGINNGMMFEY